MKPCAATMIAVHSPNFPKPLIEGGPYRKAETDVAKTRKKTQPAEQYNGIDIHTKRLVSKKNSNETGYDTVY